MIVLEYQTRRKMAPSSFVLAERRLVKVAFSNVAPGGTYYGHRIRMADSIISWTAGRERERERERERLLGEYTVAWWHVLEKINGHSSDTLFLQFRFCRLRRGHLVWGAHNIRENITRTPPSPLFCHVRAFDLTEDRLARLARWIFKRSNVKISWLKSHSVHTKKVPHFSTFENDWSTNIWFRVRARSLNFRALKFRFPREFRLRGNNWRRRGNQ